MRYRLTPVDAEIGEMLRRGDRPVLMVANKADNEARQTAALEFYEMGLGDPMPVSAYHGLGVREVQDRLIEILPTAAAGTAIKQLRLASGVPTLGSRPSSTPYWARPCDRQRCSGHDA
jgi:GTP-binding protein